MKKAFYLSLAACLILSTAQAQTPREKKFELYRGKPAIIKKLSDLKPALQAQATKGKLARPMSNPVMFRFDEVKKFKKDGKIRGGERDIFDRAEPDENDATALVQPNTATHQVWSNFLASTFDEYPYTTPPDPNGAVGPSQVITVTNGVIRVFEKRAVTDAPLVSSKGVSRKPETGQFSILLDNFFSPLLPENSYTSDPHIRYDRLTKRWFIVAIEVNQDLQNNFVLLAVSDGDHITDASSFLYYRFPSALFSYSSDVLAKPFLDFPRMGIDKNAVLIGGSDFFFHFYDCGYYTDSLYSVGYAIDKKRLLHGELALYAIKLGSIDAHTGAGGGVIIPQGVYNDNPAAPKSFFAGISYFLDGIVLAGLTYNEEGKLVDVSETQVTVQPFQFPRDVTALGSPMPIDPLDTRLLAVAIHKNKLTGKSGLWTAHAIGVNQSGNFVPDSVFVKEARTGARWYDIEDIYSKPHIAQWGTLYDGVQPSGRRAIQYFNPSIAASGQGHAILGGTTAAYNQYLNAFISGRYYADEKGTLGAVQKVTATRALYELVYGNYLGRWGDYSQTVVDPVDDQTMWSFQEYANADDSYGLRAIQVKAPPPATPLPLNAISNKDNLWVTIKGVSVDNSGFFDPGSDKGGPGYNRLSVKVSGNLLATNIKLVSPTEIRFWLNARNKPAGKYTLVITNPDGQVVTTELEITAETLKAVTATNANLIKEVQAFSTASSVTPNPTAGNFTMQINAAQIWTARVVVMDVTGKQLLVSTYSLGKGSNQFDLSLAGYDKGTYLVAVYNQNNLLIAVQKIIKQ